MKPANISTSALSAHTGQSPAAAAKAAAAVDPPLVDRRDAANQSPMPKGKAMNSELNVIRNKMRRLEGQFDTLNPKQVRSYFSLMAESLDITQPDWREECKNFLESLKD